MSIPSPGDLSRTIAAKANVDVSTVETVLKANGVTLVPVPPARRRLDIRRLTFSGTRSRTQWDGPFAAQFEFSDGVTALITNENLRGKSSVLELITWALRGSPRKLRADVRLWFERIVLEYSVNDVPMAVVITKGESGFLADILRASDADELASHLAGEEPSGSVHYISTGLSEPEFREQQDQLMLSLLSLEPITNFQRRKDSDQGDTRDNTWPAYFGGIYLPPAGSEILFGDVVFAALPARILQLFCNVPLMSTQIRLATLEKVIRQGELNQNRRIAEDAAARFQTRRDLVVELEAVNARLAALPTATGRSYETIAAELRRAERALDTASADARATGATFNDARSARQAEEQRTNSHRETVLAEILFQGLSPKHCPRCEQEFETQRVTREEDLHECSVCTKPFLVGEVDTGDVGEPEVFGDALAALKEAEEAAGLSAEAARTAADDASAVVQDLARALAAASRADEFTDRMRLQLEQARLLGRLEGIPEGGVEQEPSESLRVIEAATKILTEITGAAAHEMFEDLNTEILTLGRKFSIENLEKVELSRQGGMQVTTAGAEVPFSRVTGGERLRLRVAVIVALLRVGARSGVGSHPGLILLDSPGSDELTVHDEATLLKELDSLKEELPGLQVVIASAEPAAVEGHLPPDHIYSNLEGGPLW
ncbi:ATP-binding protein [Cellulomonas sp.]|uniref:ATP-binding protein n=1 Tax=Cellulomonas sp. TaxID=40001 RepID=UPI001B2E0431|nr:ATP-binding protein [Cellulomonas sp.]MBO9553172.1 AAA family ATPase [Cellulomonas sp.]